MPHASNASTSLAPRSAWPALICWFAVFLDGFDLVALGAIIPDLLDGEVLGFTSSSVTTVSTMSLVGVALGASLVGVIAARIGRRPGARLRQGRAEGRGRRRRREDGRGGEGAGRGRPRR